MLHSTSYECAGYFQDLLWHRFLQGLHQLVARLVEFLDAFFLACAAFVKDRGLVSFAGYLGVDALSIWSLLIIFPPIW
jgi:hypothetical protein